MRKTNFLILSAMLMLVATVFITSCGEDEKTTITGDALFSYESDGLSVTFTNETDVTPPVTYLWDFGDGETATEENPVHTFAVKGEYLVMLTVTDQYDGTHEVSTSIAVDRKGRIALDDNTLDDWNVVTEDQFVVPLGDNSGVVVSAKYEYDADFVYAYIEWKGNINDFFAYDVFFDLDNDSTTGHVNWMWPKSGAEYLGEFNPFTGEAAPGGFKYTGADGTGDWSWEQDAALPANSIILGTMKQVGNNIAAEIGFNRSAVGGGQLQNDEVAMGAFISDATWATVGFVPDISSADARKGYFILKMY